MVDLAEENNRLVSMCAWALLQGAEKGAGVVFHNHIYAWENIVEMLEDRGLIEGNEADGFVISEKALREV